MTVEYVSFYCLLPVSRALVHMEFAILKHLIVRMRTWFRQPMSSYVKVLLNDPAIVPNPSTPLSEDCLYLNIWSPRCENEERSYTCKRRKLATMVWIHGGLLTFGSSTLSLYNGAVLAASECVIVASFNYRVGPLGFLSLDIHDNPGNMGYLDAALALRWISDNVNMFGGRRDSITVFGNSAGAGISTAFLISPLTKHLVKNAIIQSGAAASTTVSLGQRSKETALNTAFVFAAVFNCQSYNATATLECLKRVSAANLTQGYLAILQGLTNFMTGVVDGYFLNQPILDSLTNEAFKRCNILIGTAKDDGTSILNFLWPQDYNFRAPGVPRPLTDEADNAAIVAGVAELDQKLIQLFTALFKQEYSAQLLADVKKVYQLDLLKQKVPDASLTLLNFVATDIFFACSARSLATVYASASQNVYLYSFNHFPDITRLPAWGGVPHQSEIPFIFGNNVPDIPSFSPREVRLSGRIMNLWANFAKYGDPNGKHQMIPRWPTYSPPDPSNILLFTEATDVRVGQTEARRCDYWNNLPRDYFRN